MKSCKVSSSRDKIPGQGKVSTMTQMVMLLLLVLGMLCMKDNEKKDNS